MNFESVKKSSQIVLVLLILVIHSWLSQAQVIVFVGTSFNVRLPEIALEHARAESIPVYNFNTQDFLGATPRLNCTNVSGPAEETIPRLWQLCSELEAQKGIEKGRQDQDT